MCDCLASFRRSRRVVPAQKASQELESDRGGFHARGSRDDNVIAAAELVGGGKSNGRGAVAVRRRSGQVAEKHSGKDGKRVANDDEKKEELDAIVPKGDDIVNKNNSNNNNNNNSSRIRSRS
eukprot:TRINITY_DN66461_c6_g1_i1.p2 TRINITY_DN66461_c6_g1~~TRINITY_DN66461_c6_g1_i1.p2  ORF type:complete len:122 (-),score=62.08 TRINITY_DN66461_c6_g1_i1:267-632(-)